MTAATENEPGHLPTEEPVLEGPAPTSEEGAAKPPPPADDIEALAPLWSSLLELESLPAGMVDLDALDHNAKQIAGALGARPIGIRLVTAEVRCTGVLRHLFTVGPRNLQGLQASSVGEAVLLSELGFDDILIGVPPTRAVDAEQVAELVSGGRQVTVLVDDPAHLTLLSSAAREAGVEIGICLEVDTTWQPIAEVLVGAPRSPIQDSEQARAFAGRARELGGLKVVGVLAWEAAAAALGANVHPWAVGPLKSLFRRRSAAAAADRRGAVVQVLREEGHPIALVSGGSTQTLDLAAADPMLTEVSVGAGFLCPTRGENVGLNLRPAVHFAISVARKPDPESLVCAGGGWLSAGPGDGAPIVVSPRNLAPALPLGWGETWTHLRATAGEARLQIGDPVVCRPAKVGPMMERLTQVVLHRGTNILERAPTYRGLGLPG